MRHLIEILVILILSTFGQNSWASEWSVHEQNLMGLGGHIEAVEKDIAALVHQNELTVDPVVKNQLLTEIAVLEEELQGERDKLAIELRHIRYQHPERGQDFSLALSNFNMDLPEIMVEMGQLEQLTQEAQQLLRRVYGANFQDPNGGLRSPSSDTSAVEISPMVPRWVLEK